MKVLSRVVIGLALLLLPCSMAMAAATKASVPPVPPAPTVKQTASKAQPTKPASTAKTDPATETVAAKPTKEQIAAAFTQYTKAEMEKVYTTYKGNHYQLLFIKANSLINQNDGWVKTVNTISPTYKAVIVKDNPFIGSLEVDTTTTFLQKCATKEAAAATKITTRSIKNKYKFELRYQNDKWVVTGAQDYDSSLGQWFDGEKNILKALSCKDENH